MKIISMQVEWNKNQLYWIDRYLLVGGNDVDNKPLNNCYGLTIGKANETWINLPNLPVKIR